jgi:hypothetical protein
MTAPFRAPLPVDRTALEDYRERQQRRNAPPPRSFMDVMREARERAEAVRQMERRDMVSRSGSARDVTARAEGDSPAAGSFGSMFESAPYMAKTIGRQALDFTPVGDVLAVRDGVEDASEGNYGSAALNIASALPIIGTAADAWKPISRGIFDRGAREIQGTVKGVGQAVGDAAGPKMTTSPLVDAIMDSKVVRRGMDADADVGMGMGGPEWYELGPLKAFIEETPDAIPLENWNLIGAASSANNSIPNELSASTITNWAEKRGLSMLDGKSAYREAMGGDVINPAMMNSHFDVAREAVRSGRIGPKDAASAAHKLPSYHAGRQGMGGELDIGMPGNAPALDTHERRRIMQLAAEDPQIRKFMRELDIPFGQHSDVLPLQNSLDYRDIGSLYVDGAKRKGLPTAQAYQASRWTGGWDKTGLKSPPRGDYIQLLEDAVTYSAQRRGFDDSPKALREYMARILRGDDFIVPYAGGGGYPIR